MIVLWTDGLLYILLLGLALLLVNIYRRPFLKQNLNAAFKSPLRMIALIILITFVLLGLLDSIHYRANGDVASVLDWLLQPMSTQKETSYSPPFATELFVEQMQKMDDGEIHWVKPRLQFVQPTQLLPQIGFGLLFGGVASMLILLACKIIFGRVQITAVITLVVLCAFIAIIHRLMQFYHVLGTNKVGVDVLYISLKSIRTGLVIGTVTTLITLPFAIFFGTIAGYFRGITDDLVQYIYTTLSSIPAVLLIAASMLSFDAAISRHDNMFTMMAQRTDMRLLILCTILGVTSWTVLCRILRGETLKLRELDFILVAKVMGTSNLKIIAKHVLPNLMHIIIITVVLDFSALVLAEAVLSYVGVGVDPSTYSWGNMINSARMELGREPIIWWSLFGAFTFMFTLVLAANICADGIRDAFDTRK